MLSSYILSKNEKIESPRMKYRAEIGQINEYYDKELSHSSPGPKKCRLIPADMKRKYLKFSYTCPKWGEWETLQSCDARCFSGKEYLLRQCYFPGNWPSVDSKFCGTEQTKIGTCYKECEQRWSGSFNNFSWNLAIFKDGRVDVIVATLIQLEIVKLSISMENFIPMDHLGERDVQEAHLKEITGVVEAGNARRWKWTIFVEEILFEVDCSHWNKLKIKEPLD